MLSNFFYVSLLGKQLKFINYAYPFNSHRKGF